MRYKVGDKVIVVNKELKAYCAVGVIEEIDEEWVYPYGVDFGDASFDEDLFAEIDLRYADEDENVEEPKEDRKPREFIDIAFQNGTVEDRGVNGAQIEDVIDVLVERLIGFQKGGFPCRENALAITHLQEAQNWLYRRTIERKKQGVEGKHEKHE